MAIYRGEGGAGDATADASNAAALADSFADAANASAGQAATSAAAALAAKVAAETAETNAETAETNAETAEAAAVVAKNAAEAVLLDTGFTVVASDLQGDDNIGTVADDIVNVNAVATNIAAVIAVDADEANINIVAADGTDIGTVATNIADVNAVGSNILDVTAVADNETNIDAVAANATNINTVSGISGNVTTVAGISANVTSVAGNSTNINTVATDITNVNAVGTNITNVNSVAGNATNINAVNSNATNINTVAGISGNVTTVAGISADVTAVAGIDQTDLADVAAIDTDVTTVAGISGNVTTVAGISANVTSVAGNSTNINTVATDIANVNTVATNIANVNTTATNIANVNTVAGISANVTTVADISANVTTVATNNANVTTVAGSIANVNTVGNNIANVNQVAADTVVINSASANATAAAASATAADVSATSASASAAAASAVALGNEPVRHSVRPSLLLDFANTKQLDPRITFTRGSTASFYDGRTVAKAEENLQTYSQQLNDTNGWTPSDVTVTANAGVAPDGTTTAELLSETATNNVHWIFTNNGVFTSIAATYTYSLFLKKGTGATAPDIIQLTFRSAGAGLSQYANFDISVGGGTSGTVTASADLTSSSITAVGNGWYRCSITRVLSATSNAGGTIAFANNNPTGGRGSSYLGVTTADVLVWGAQLEQRSSVTAYTATTTAPITNYIPALQTAASGVARFEHNPTTGESLGLEIEEQRTNLLFYSSQFDDASWQKSASSIVANTIIAPDGTLTGDRIVEDATSASHWVFLNPSFTSGTTYTASVFAKAGERTQIHVQVGGTSAFGGLTSAIFDLSTVTVVSTSNSPTTSITSVGNGWYRLTVTKAATATGAPQLQIGLAASASTTYTGNGYSGAYIWGAQLEAGSFATSYIPTVASQVTRSADAASMTGTNFSSWYRADEGTLYTESARVSTTANLFPRVVQLDDGTANNVISLLWQTSTSKLYASTTFNGSLQVDLGVFGLTQSANNKIALGYKVSDFANSVNGSTVATSTSASVPLVTNLRIGRSLFGVDGATTLKKLAYYPRRLTNAEIVSLSTV